MTQRSGRITCPKCGANNFETVTACWKCGTSLGSAGTVSQMGTPLPVAGGAMSYGVERPASQQYAPPPQPSGDPNVATRAAILLAITIPWIGLPAGWLFMMVENPKTQRVGRICVNWSLIALLFHIVITSILMKSASDGIIKILIPLMKSMSQSGGGGGGGLPGEGF